MSNIDAKIMADINLQKSVSSKTSFNAFNYLQKKWEDERCRGIGASTPPFPQIITENYELELFEPPNSNFFVRNLISGRSKLDLALLIISAAKAEYESQLDKTKEYCHLLTMFSIRKIIVVITKMDTVDYSEKRFNEICSNISQLFNNIMIKPEIFEFIPISGINGENLTHNSPKFFWYKSLTLIQAIDNVPPEIHSINKPLRIAIQDVFDIPEIGTVPVGRVEYGILKPGDVVSFAPSGAKGTVQSIEMHHEKLEQAVPNDNIGFCVVDIKKEDIKKGEICGLALCNPPLPITGFIAQIVILNHPGTIKIGYIPAINCHFIHAPCKFSEFISLIDPKTGKEIEKCPKSLKKGDIAIVFMEPMSPICIEPFTEFPTLGKFSVHDMKTIVAVGIVKSVVKIDFTIKEPIKEKSGIEKLLID